MSTYRLVHRLELDAIGWRLGDGPGDPPTSIDVVSFVIPAPVDDHERTVRLTLSRPAWESQGSPEELLVALSAPITEDQQPEHLTPEERDAGLDGK